MNDSPAMLRLLERFHLARIICLGDLMLDRYVYGTVERISAEAPIPIIRDERNESVLGGVGNVARNIAAAGGQAQSPPVLGSAEQGLTPTVPPDDAPVQGEPGSAIGQHRFHHPHTIDERCLNDGEFQLARDVELRLDGRS